MLSQCIRGGVAAVTFCVTRRNKVRHSGSKPVVRFEPLGGFTGNREEPSREKTPDSGAATERSFRAAVSNSTRNLRAPKQRRYENLALRESSACSVDMQGGG